MRLLGLDVSFKKDASKDDLIQSMINDKRVILTTDKRLLMRKTVERGYCVRSKDPKFQTLEVIQRFDLINFINPFTRCVYCNNTVDPVEKAKISNYLEPKTRKFYHEFSQCPNIYTPSRHHNA